MTTLIVQFIEQDDTVVDIVGATVSNPEPNADKILSDLVSLMVTHIQQYSSILPPSQDTFLKAITHAMLAETLEELKQDLLNIHKIVAVCYLLRTLETDVPLKALKLTIGKHSCEHSFIVEPFIATTVRS